MNNLLEELIELEEPLQGFQLEDLQIGNIKGVQVGKLLSIKNGCILVDYPENPFPPLPARSIVTIGVDDKNRDVVLTFEKSDPKLPIIIGLLQTQPVVSEEKYSPDQQRDKDVFIDGKRLIFNAEMEIELRCGNSSLIMRKDGKVVIKGTQLTSRASRENKIKGAVVIIN